MANDLEITVRGNLVRDPEFREWNGKTVGNITIAQTPSMYNREKGEWEDMEALFINGSVWRNLAANLKNSPSMKKGTRVVAVGRLKATTKTNDNGDKRTFWNLDIIDLAPSLIAATVGVEKTSGGNNSGGNSGWSGSGNSGTQSTDGWGDSGSSTSGSSTSSNDDPPF